MTNAAILTITRYMTFCQFTFKCVSALSAPHPHTHKNPKSNDNHTVAALTTAAVTIYLLVSDHTCQHDQLPSMTSVDPGYVAVTRPTLSQHSNARYLL